MQSETLLTQLDREVGVAKEDLSETASCSSEISQDLDVLICQVMKRDRTAFLTLYDRVSTPLYSLALSMLSSEEYASDVLQETFAWVWVNCHEFRKHKGSAFSWLVGLVRRRTVLRIGKEGSNNASTIVHSTALEGQQTPGNFKIREAFKSLSENEQRVIKMAFFGGFSQQEIAEKTGSSPEITRRYAFEGMARLHDAIRNRP